MLSSRGWLSRCDPDFRVALIGNGLFRRFPAGYVIGLAGEERGWMFGLASGSLELTPGESAIDAPFIHIGQRGFWAGYRPLLGEAPRSITSTAREDAVLLTIDQGAVLRLLSAHPGWWKDIARLADEVGTLAFVSMSDNLLRDPVRRAAAILLRLAGVRLPLQGQEALPVRASRDELAAAINVGRNTLGPILRGFEASGWIRTAYRETLLADVAALHRLVHG